MTDLSKLSYKELQELEKQIEERKQVLSESNDCVEGYKVTFCVKFNPATNPYSDLRSPEDFGDYLANDIANVLVNDFGLRQSDVSSFEVEWMNDEYKVEWKDFWEGEE
jgi:hypothetical protein